MMFDRAYRERLEADLAQWEADGVITPAGLATIRVALPPLGPGINIPVVVAIVGGLLIAAAFLAFVAAHWTELARLARLAILLAGSVGAHASVPGSAVRVGPSSPPFAQPWARSS